MHGEFLRLLQMAETGRKVEGRDHIEILDTDVSKAQELDGMQTAHLGKLEITGHKELDCVECAEVSRGRVEQRESLHARKIDFPVEVFASR